MNLVSSAARSATRLGRAGLAVILAIAVLPVVLLTGAGSAAAGPAPVFTMYVPLEEQDISNALIGIAPGGTAFNDIVTTIDITSAADESIVYWDHWEDGYEPDIANPVQASTQVWGDNNAANGTPPGGPVADDVDAGTIIFLQNTVPLPRLTTDVVYDGRDKVAATRGFSMTRAGWDDGIGTLHAGAVATTDLSKYGTSFDLPVGENIGNTAFSYTGVGVLASDDNTVVRIDVDGDGDVIVLEGDIITTLQRGQTTFVNGGVNAGATVQTSKPSQVHAITGERGSNYEGRWYEIFPEEIRGDEYVAAAASTSADAHVDVYIQNPNDWSIDIDIDAQGTLNDETITLSAGAFSDYLVPVGSGVRLSSPGNPFVAVSATGSTINPANPTLNRTHWFDWGYSLVPTSSLTSLVVVGWGDGAPGIGATTRSPIWVTPLADTTIRVESDPNSVGYEQTIPALAFQSVAIIDTDDQDMTGARIDTNDQTLISVAWGQDPSHDECCAAYDLGSAVLPTTSLVVTKNHLIANDLNSDGNVNPGDVIEYTITAVDAGAADLTNVSAEDVLPSTVTYVPGTTTLRVIDPAVSPPAASPVDDDTVGATAFPVDETGVAIGGIAAGGSAELKFQAEVVSPFPPFVQYIRNDVEVTSTEGSASATSLISVVIPDLYVAKTGPTSPVLPGENFDYTIDVSNVSLSPQTGVAIDDTLPGQVEWNSTAVTYPIDGITFQTTDDFTPAVYNNDAADWASNWTETNDDGDPATGEIAIASNNGDDALRLRSGNRIVERSFDTTNWDSAYVSFNTWRAGFETGDAVAFEISTTAGSSWIELGSFTGAGTSTLDEQITFDLTRYVGQDIGMRFVTTGTFSNDDQLFIDDFSMDVAERVPFATVGGAPPSLWSGGTLLTGETATITVNVDVIDPIDPTIDNFTNIASAASVQNATPVVSAWTVEVARASIGDTVWHDQNGDGVVDAGEPRLNGVTVELFESGNPTSIDSAITGATGDYLFDDLDPGDYAVEIAGGVPAGMDATFDDDGGRDDTTDVSVTFDEDNTSTDFGYAFPVSLGDRVFADVDGNAVEDGVDFGLAGLLVTITGPSHPTGATTNTAGGGNVGFYEFTNLLPGSYDVTVDTTGLSPTSYATTAGSNGGDTQTHVLVSETDVDSADFGYVIPAAIGDLVWHDLDADGVFDVGEPPFVGVTVTIDAPSLGTPLTRTTDANGYYLFSNLDADTYDVTVSLATGDLPVGYDSSTGGATQTITVAADQSIDTGDFGFYTPGTIGDVVFNDLNGDGDQDVGEPGIENVTVTLDNGSTVVTVNTGSGATAGEYDFTNVEPGSYTVSVNTSGFPAGTVTSLDGSAAIVLESTDDFDDADFGYVYPATFGDFVFHDLNNSGTFDAGEPGINGVELTLTNPALAVPLTDTTQNGGQYLFADLEPGTYTVTLNTATLPAGYIVSTGSTTDTAVVSSGTAYLDGDFGARTTADIGDFVFHDLDADGTFDSGEPALSGVEVTLTGGNLAAPLTDITDGSGNYLFADLDPGSYTVTVTTATVPAGYLVTAGNDTRSTTLVSDSDDLSLDFGYATTASIGDYVWDDLNGDGLQNDGLASVVGIESVDVTISGTSAGASHAGGFTQQTDADGGYLFDNLAPGTYEVSIALTGVIAGAANTGPGVVSPTAVTQTISVASDQDVDTTDFGVYEPADIGDLLFDDLNADGDRDAGEPGLNGVNVTLNGTTAAGAIVPVTMSTVGGAYTFSDLAPGSYTVTLNTSDLPTGWVNTLGGTSQATTIISGADDLTLDFGFFTPAALGNLVFDDLDGDGTRDAGDLGIDGVTITLYSGATALAANQLGTDNTSGGGIYNFTGLLPGTYTVEIDTADLDANATITTAGGSTTFTTTLTSGETDDTLDYGVANPVSVGDLIFEDLNGNGSFDSGEPAIADATGITIDLTGDDTNTVSTTNGSYSFGNLLPGSYTVAIDLPTVPAGYTATTPTTFSDTYESGDAVTDLDFGFVRPAGLGDFVFDDLDGDGSFDSGEPGLLGVTLELSGPGVAPGTTFTTTGTGAYSFGSLTPGLYTVTITDVPAGYSNTLGGASQSTTLESNQTDDTLDFGYFLGASIGDEVYDDLDGNGIRGAGEPGLDNVVLTLTGTNSGGPIAPTTANTGTGGSGAYDFAGLEPGTYTVTITSGVPGAMVNTDGGASQTFTVASGDDVDTADFGYYTPATLGDAVWDDLDGDGAQNEGIAADRGIENVTVTLYTGTTVNVANIVTTDDTDANGAYDFTGLAPGTYTVAIDTGDLAAGAVTTTGGFVIDTIVIESGDDINSADFGVANPASVGDLVFADIDGNGVFSIGDAHLDGVTVTLTGGNLGAGSVVDTTGSDGIYGFDSLYPGAYTVTVSSTGDLDGNEFSTTGGLAQTVTVISGQTDTTIDFGFAEPASIGDTLFHDLDGDGVQDAGEPGLPDVDVTITGPSHPAGLTIQTGNGASAGQYAFTSLTPGSYTVVVNTADGDMNPLFVSTTGGNSQIAALSAGQNIDTVDFGYTAPIAIGDFVFTDPNGDGNQSDAVALGSVQLELRDALNGLAGTTTSNATTGAYSFTGVMPGAYTVNVIGGLPADAFSTTGGNGQTLTAVSATNIDTIDFGYAQPATIGDLVYVDADGSGTFNAGDPGTTATITITGISAGASHPTGTAVVATGGNYSITGLNPGTYNVSVSGLPAGATRLQGAADYTLTVVSGETDNSADFGFWLPASIGNEVFEDMNADADRDLADVDFSGVTLTLTGPGVAANTTATSGTNYSFDNLAPGTYTVAVTAAPAGAVNTLGGTSQTVSVSSGETNNSVDFGFYTPSTIGDYVYDDLDGDGVQNDGTPADRGVSGVELTLTGITETGAITPVTDTTDGDGAYDFGALAPGTYQVAITAGLPAGAVSTTGGNTISTISITSGTDNDDVDFGIALPASLGDFVFEDIDGNGTVDGPGDAGFSNVTVTVLGISSNASHQAGTTVTTGSVATAGAYGLDGLLPGTYTVTVSPGTGDLPGNAASSTGGNTQTVTLTSGQTDLSLDFGYTLPASIGDQLFVDNNANGVFDTGDTALGLVDITLTGPGQGAGGTTQATLNDGSYDFSDLAPGEYTVTVDVTDPQFVAIFGSGAASTAISSTGGNSQTITIESTDNIDTVDFGYYALGSIGDLVFTDTDGNGSVDTPADTGIENVTVTLDGGDLANPITTTTGTGGNAGDYLFNGLTPGTYTVTVTVPGQTATTPGASGGTVQTITLLSGTDIDTADFGFIAPASVGDLLFDDLDGDGVRDVGEPGLENVTVTLTGTTAGGAISPITTTTGTAVGGDAGEYGFDNLLPGAYTVTVSNGTGDLGNAIYASTTGGDSQNVSLVSGQIDTKIDFGYMAPGSIGDFVFDDLDGDGVQQVGEPGIGSVVVQLSGGGLGSPITTLTDTGASAGQYSFPNLAPGTYDIEIISGLPAGAVRTLGDSGYTVTLVSAETRDDIDFGAYQPISIGDLVFTDENGTGTHTPAGGDTPINGVQLTLSGGDLATDLIDTTDSNGIYGFGSLTPGDYTLTVTGGIPADHVSTTGGNTVSFTLTSGNDDFTLDFGLNEPITIGDLVWHDTNGDGDFDSGEPGLGAVDLELVDGNGLVVDTTTSAATTGAYLFTNVAPSPLDYTVRIVTTSVPAGYSATTPESIDVTATSGDNIVTADFGYVTLTSIGDYVWEDADGDTVQDVGENGLSGLTVTLTGGALANPLTEITGTNGDYTFASLAPGTYTVTVTPPANVAPTTTGASSQMITVLSGSPVDTVDFGYAFGATIGDRIWNDLDADGIDDAEPGLGSVEVLLTGNGVSLSDTTDGNGAYSFTGLTPGEYTITINGTTVPVGANSGSQLTPTTAITTTLTVASGDLVDTVDYGYATTATIGDTIFDDLDGNGLEGVAEPGLDGVTVELVDSGNTVVDTDVTNAGVYEFAGVAPGAYTVRVVTSTLPAGGYTQTTNPTAASVSVESDDAIDTVDLGFTRPSTIGDFIWHDLDTDGTFDVGEPGLNGVTVNVFDAGLNIVGSDTTDGSGTYLVAGIEPGTYTVQVDTATLPNGINSGTQLAASATVPASISRTVESGDSVTDADFAFHTTATIGDQIWHDLDANGVDDDGPYTDAWLDAVTVELLDPVTNGVVATTTTADGLYSFAGVAPGTYAVSVDESTVPATYSSTTGNNPTTVTVESDQLIDTVDFGYAALSGGSIGNEIFDDLNGDGDRDAGEPGIVLTAELWSGGSMVGTRTTTGGGYVFGNLAPGTYEVRVVDSTIPAGYASSTTAGANVSNSGNTQTFTIQSGDTPITTADFGYVAAATVGDFVWHDIDADGLQNDGAPADVGLAGITVELRNSGGTVVGSDVTDTDGSYQLSAAPGTYDVVVLSSSIPDGTNSGAPMTPTTVSTVAVTLVSNELRTNVDFGFSTTASIGDTIFDDLDGDGIQQTGEPGLPDIVVELFDGVSTITVTTGPNGEYTFSGLAPGDYSVTVVATSLPAGAYATTTTDPVDVTVESDDFIDDVDLGFTVPGTITGEVFVDSDGDATQAGESNIATEVDVDLLDGGGNVIATVTTVGGVYTFLNVIPGEYTVSPTLPAGLILTVPNAGSDDSIDSDVDPSTTESAVITMTSGATISDVDAGVYQLATIGDTVFVDLDGDGAQSSDEPGLVGVSVEVRDAGGNVFGSDTTDVNGEYSIDVVPGDHVVSITVPLGYAAGVAGTAQAVAVASGSIDNTIDFPVVGAGQLTGSVIYDISNDGSIDADDPGLGGVAVTATWDGPDGPVVFDTVTNPDGSYVFTGLPAGDFTVVVDPSTLPNGIIDPTVDPDAAIDLETVATVGSTIPATGIDFAVSGTASLGDNVFLDSNENGQLDQGESGVPGVTVIATVETTAGLMTYTTITDGNGNYEFTDLPAGDYTVSIDLTTVPAGMRATVDSLSSTLVINGFDDSVDVPLVMMAGPQAIDDAETTEPSTPVIVPVLDDDDVRDGTTVTVVAITQPTHGTSVLNANGTVTYTPDDGFAGVDTFEYTICDLESLEAAGDTPANRAVFCSTATVEVVTPAALSVVPPTTTPDPTQPVVTSPAAATPVTTTPSRSIGTPTTGTPAAGTPAAGTPASGTPVIPRTGAENGTIQLMGFGLLLAGLALWAVSRRRRNDDATGITRSNAWPAPTS